MVGLERVELSSSDYKSDARTAVLQTYVINKMAGSVGTAPTSSESESDVFANKLRTNMRLAHNYSVISASWTLTRTETRTARHNKH